MSYQVKPGSIFGRVGKGIGQGLAEQIPKEIDRTRLAQGLQAFEQEAPNLSPLQQYARLAAIPGITPQMIQTFGDLAKQQGIRNAGPISSSNIPNQSEITKNIPKPVENLKNIIPSQNKTVNNFDDKFKSLTHIEDIQNARVPIMSEEEKEQKAFDLWNTSPQRFPGGLIEARAKVDAEEASNVKQFEAARQKRSNDIELQNKTVSTLNSKIQGDLPQEIKDTFEQKAINEVADRKKTPEQAGIVQAKKANEFIKERDILKTLGMTPLTRAPEQTVNELKRIRDSYAELDALPIFVQDMKNFNGLGDHLANSIAYPISDQLNKAIPDIKQVNKKFINSDKIAENISKNFTENDSFYSLGLALEEAGFNSDEMMKKIIKLYDKNKMPLTQYQKNELTSYTPLNYTLGDIFISHFTDLFQNSKLPTKEKIRRTWYKKR